MYWAFELPGHFRAQFSVIGGVAVLLLLGLRAWTRAAVSAGCVVVVSGPVLALWLPVGPPAAIKDVPVALTVLSLNVSFYDRNHDQVVALIRGRSPDVVGLVEVNDRWVEKLSVLAPHYPYSTHDTTSRSGVALLSRVPLDSAHVRPFATGSRSFVVASLQVGGRALAVAVAHTASPVWGSRMALRNRQLETLAGIGAEAVGQEVLVMGDLNTSPWSRAFRRLIAETGWRRAGQGHGYRATWPSGAPWLGIPIDHHLVSDGIVVHQFDVLGATGSDHLALYSEIGFR